MEDTKTSEIIDETSKIIEFHNEVEARQHLLSRKNKRKEMVIPVSEWGMHVLVVAISGTARGEYYAYSNEVSEKYRGTSEFFKRLWFEQVRLACLHPVTRKPILQPADIDEFMDDEGGAIIEALAGLVRDISGLSAGAIDDIKKKWQEAAKSTDTTSSPNGFITHT